MRKTTIHSHDPLPGRHVLLPGTSDPVVAKLDDATQQLNKTLQSLERQCTTPGCDMEALTAELTEQMHRVCRVCRFVEQQLGDDEAVRKMQTEFRRRTDDYFAQSQLVKRARTWPRGYPGDYEIIDAVYDNRVVSQGLGSLFDRYFLNTTLARAIQHRREKMRDMLAEEIRARPAAHVLNIGCGPCREVCELAPLIRECGAHFTNIDFDIDALRYSARRLTAAGIADQVRFRQYNAIRMVNAKKNVCEFGRADVIYAIGLLDYLSDEIIVRLLKSLYATLKPNGVMIAVFKDSDYYSTEDYHWMSDWSAFLQRTAEASRVLLDEAELPSDAITTSRTCDNVMIFYRVVQTAATVHIDTLQGPHDRRKTAPDEETGQLKRSRHDRPKRPSWHRPEQTT